MGCPGTPQVRSDDDDDDRGKTGRDILKETIQRISAEKGPKKPAKRKAAPAPEEDTTLEDDWDDLVAKIDAGKAQAPDAAKQRQAQTKMQAAFNSALDAKPAPAESADVCQKCKAPLKPNAKFCGKCGTKAE